MKAFILENDTIKEMTLADLEPHCEKCQNIRAAQDDATGEGRHSVHSNQWHETAQEFSPFESAREVFQYLFDNEIEGAAVIISEYLGNVPEVKGDSFIVAGKKHETFEQAAFAALAEKEKKM